MVAIMVQKQGLIVLYRLYRKGFQIYRTGITFFGKGVKNLCFKPFHMILHGLALNLYRFTNHEHHLQKASIIM